jgi:hypothetical protein
MVQELLLAGQVLFVVFVYLFVWRTMKAARTDLVRRASPGAGPAAGLAAQESTILPAAGAQAARRAAGLGEPRLVVESSDVLRPGIPFTIGGGLSVGRTEGNDIVLDEGVVSGRHLRVVPPNTIVDEGSTNGTLVNGRRVSGRVALQPGDVVQVGSTAFRFEVPR